MKASKSDELLHHWHSGFPSHITLLSHSHQGSKWGKLRRFLKLGLDPRTSWLCWKVTVTSQNITLGRHKFWRTMVDFTLTSKNIVQQHIGRNSCDCISHLHPNLVDGLCCCYFDKKQMDIIERRIKSHNYSNISCVLMGLLAKTCYCTLVPVVWYIMKALC